MPAVLLATCADLPEGDEDGAVLTAALRERGLQARWAVWSDPAVDWSAGLVVIRSTWDYTTDHAAYLDWVGALPRVANDAAVIAWNTDKVYLRDLADAGVPVVPTQVVAPGQPLVAPAVEFVVKPSVGAGSRGAGRFTPDRTDAATTHLAGLHAHDRTALVQPYLGGVDTAGETALLYFGGTFSHAIRKGPMLPADVAHPVEGRELYVEESIRAREPRPAEFEVAELALQAVRDRFGADQLYTRVDLLPGPDGPVVVELELVEPSLFLQYAAGAADAFAAAVAAVAVSARA